MKRLFLSLSLALLSLSVMAPQVQAKRLGGGGNMGMQRKTPPAKTPDAPAGKPAAAPAATPATPAAPAAAATPPKRSWMGPLAGIAAGLGIGALMSHLGMGGMGGGFGGFIMMALMGVAAFMLIRFLMRRFMPQAGGQGLQFAGAGAGAGMGGNPSPTGWGSGGSSSTAAPLASEPQAAASLALPADFDTVAFERTAKLMFIRLQAANDSGDLNDLRAFTTPEMFAAAKLDLQERSAQAQQTDVVNLNSEVLEVAQDTTQQIVSIRFHGLIKEDVATPATAFDEVWHVVKPLDGHRDWAIAGITPKVH
jgi:predicted lipid-binding transport protein (Tim44 family)